jgi:preprotein translocase subunit YajC
VNGYGFVLIAIAFLFVWFALLRPQKRRRLEQAHMWESLQPGDQIVTAGGLYGEITGFRGDDAMVEIAPQLEVRVARRAIAAVIPPEQEEEEDEEAPVEEAESYSEDPR